MKTGQIVIVGDLAQDRRWGKYRLHALAHGVRASLSLPITSGNGAVGALNFYATTPHAFTDEHARTGAHFADQAAGALRLAARLADQATLTAQLQEAMSSRAVIDQAIGIVMGQNRCDANAAFNVLRRASQNRNIKLRQVAADLVEAVSGHPPAPQKPLS
jgi:GAF domain-containing protein